MSEDNSSPELSVSRRDFLKVLTGGAAGMTADRVADAIRGKEKSGIDTDALMRIETPMSKLPLKVDTLISSKKGSSVDSKTEGLIKEDEQLRKFLMGSGQIATLLAEKHLTGQLTPEDITAVADALYRLKGVERPPSSNDEPKEKSEGLEGAISDLDSSLSAV